VPRAKVEADKPVSVDEILAEVDSMEKAPEPGSLHIKDIIHRGDGDVPATMITQALTSAGWVFIYDTKTGERSVSNRNNLRDNLLKKRDDGSRVFSLRAPVGITPHRGTLKCMLHADDPNRKHYDELGLPVCRKSNLTSQFQVMRHMAARHKTELATIEQETRDKERQEELEFRRSVLAKAS
jgi:hypothetical protein